MASASDYSALIAGGTSVGTGNIIVMVLVLVAIIFAAYYVTRLISGRAIRMLRSQKMDIVDRMALAHDKQIMILRVGDEAHLIGVTGSQITELALLPPEILDEPEAAQRPAPGAGDTFFSRFMSAMKENYTAKTSQYRRPRSAYERAKSEYERSVQEHGGDATNQGPRRKGDNIDDMADMARRRNDRYGRPGDSE